MKKKIVKFINNLFNRPIVKFVSYILLVFLIFTIYGVFDNTENSIDIIIQKITSIVSSEETLSVFLAGIISIGIARFIKNCNSYLEESFKIDDDHHAIIGKYNGHAKKTENLVENQLDSVGTFMRMTHTGAFNKKELKNKEKDKFSKKYKSIEQDIKNFENGYLFLPTINVFANIDGKTNIVFEDYRDMYLLPDYVISNAERLLAAHKNSNTTNNNTIRLFDVSYDNKTLKLHTQRSTYYHMLLTNRCMDYSFHEGLTIRSLYEYNNTISLLKDSKLGNQIGINGLILSSDGYVLIEKRDHSKTTWKNKFAQSISLALKESDLKLTETRTIGGTPDNANDNFSRIIRKTVKDNFGLLPEDYETFEVAENFLGLARDLLEGGKPNLYFFITTNYTAEVLAKKLRDNAASVDPEMALRSSKLKSDYYLVPFDDIRISYNYSLKINRKNVYRIHRRVYPRTSRIKSILYEFKHTLAEKFTPYLIRECGEALLVTLSYLELCRPRIQAINYKEKIGK